MAPARSNLQSANPSASNSFPGAEPAGTRPASDSLPGANPASAAPLPANPAAGPQHLIFSVEAGGLEVSLVDAQLQLVVHRFAPPRKLIGQPVFSPDARHAYWASVDGWITRYDLLARRVVGEFRAAERVSGLAVSGDGRWLMVASAEPRALTLLDAELRPQRSYPAPEIDGDTSIGAPAVRDARGQKSFVVGFAGGTQLWELSYDPNAEPIFDGLVHDYRSGEGIARSGYLGLRRTLLEAPLDQLFLSPDERHVLGLARGTTGQLQVVNLDVRRRIASVQLPGLPNPGAATVWTASGTGTALLAIPDCSGATASLLDPRGWKLAGSVDLPAAAAGGAPAYRVADGAPGNGGALSAIGAQSCSKIRDE